MLFFVDESFHVVAGTRVGALGAVAIPADRYNWFCGWTYRLKREELGAVQLNECELKGNSCFSRSVMRWDADGHASPKLEAVSRVVKGLTEVQAVVFALWTDQPELLSLRDPAAASLLTFPYVRLLRMFKNLMIKRPGEPRAQLFLDQLGHREDMKAACSIQNYLARSDERKVMQKFFQQVPHYTHSAVSPGLQVADLIAYLAAEQYNPSHRPELAPWWDQFRRLGQYEVTTVTGAPRKVYTTGPLPSPQPPRPRRSPDRSDRRTSSGPKRR